MKLIIIISFEYEGFVTVNLVWMLYKLLLNKAKLGFLDALASHVMKLSVARSVTDTFSDMQLNS